MFSLLWLLIVFGPSSSLGLSCHINATAMIDCASISLRLADYYTPACFLLVWRENLTTYQYCSLSLMGTPAADSCQLVSHVSGEYWTCLCGASGCNNVSVISESDVVKMDVASEVQPMPIISMESMTEPEGKSPLITSSLQQAVTSAPQEQSLNNRLSVIIAIWTGVLIVAVIIVSAVGALYRWKRSHHNEPKTHECI